jgi:hypothetical protein
LGRLRRRNAGWKVPLAEYGVNWLEMEKGREKREKREKTKADHRGPAQRDGGQALRKFGGHGEA